MGPLEAEVRQRLPWLLQDLGFRVVTASYEYRSFGDSVVELHSDAILLRLIRERSRVLPQVASPADPGNWFELGVLWFALTDSRPEPELDGWAWFIRDKMEDLAKALGPQLAETQTAYERAQEASRALSRAYSPPARHPHLLPPILTLRRTLGILGWIVAAGVWIWAIHR